MEKKTKQKQTNKKRKKKLTLNPHKSFACLQRLRSKSAISNPSLHLLKPGVRVPSGAVI